MMTVDELLDKEGLIETCYTCTFYKESFSVGICECDEDSKCKRIQQHEETFEVPEDE